MLDVACGTGELERLIATASPEQSMVGVDFSAAMLAIARAKCAAYPHVTFQEAPATALPWHAPQFDCVVCANAFHYFDNSVQVLGEVKRVLPAAGRLIILDWCRDFWLCQVCDWVLGWIDPSHKQCYTEAELHQFLTTAGYAVMRS